MRDKAPTTVEFRDGVDEIKCAIDDGNFGQHDIERAIKLANAKGTGHDQFLTGIIVQFDLTFSNKAWVEGERYKFLDFISSMSTMHRATKFNLDEMCNEYVTKEAVENAQRLIKAWAEIDGDKNPEEKKKAFLKVVYNLPAGVEITAGMSTNYRSLKNIYAQRRTHRLPDWWNFCDWVETLPLANELITGRAA